MIEAGEPFDDVWASVEDLVTPFVDGLDERATGAPQGFR